MMSLLRSLLCLALLATISAGAAHSEQHATVLIDGHPVFPMHGSVTGFWLFAEDDGAQLALMNRAPQRILVTLDRDRRITIRTAVDPVSLQAKPLVDVRHLESATAIVQSRLESTDTATYLIIDVSAPDRPAATELDALRVVEGNNVVSVAINPRRRAYPQTDAVRCSPPLRPAIEQALIEWDWRMQDGIATLREPRSYAEAMEEVLSRGDVLVDDLTKRGSDLGDKKRLWRSLREYYRVLQEDAAATETQWESLWLSVHRLRRKIALSNPLADIGPLVFAKRVPSVNSHQLTQYYGYTAQPGGGLFVLTDPGRSMQVKQLATSS